MTRTGIWTETGIATVTGTRTGKETGTGIGTATGTGIGTETVTGIGGTGTTVAGTETGTGTVTVIATLAGLASAPVSVKGHGSVSDPVTGTVSVTGTENVPGVNEITRSARNALDPHLVTMSARGTGERVVSCPCLSEGPCCQLLEARRRAGAGGATLGEEITGSGSHISMGLISCYLPSYEERVCVVADAVVLPMMRPVAFEVGA